jgi:hypothetical protein
VPKGVDAPVKPGHDDGGMAGRLYLVILFQASSPAIL